MFIFCKTVLQGISDATNIVIYHAGTIEKSEKKNFHNFTFFLAIKTVLDFLKWLNENGFYEKKERNYYKNINFSKKGKFILRRKKEFFGLRKS